MAALSVDGLDAEDLRAVASMRETLDLLASDDPMLTMAIDTADPDDRPADDILANDGLGALLGRSAAAFTRAADDLRFDGRPVGRTEILGRLATEPDPGTRRRLFLALEPIWQAVDGDGGPASPYRIALQASAEAWRRDGSPVDANARALGVDPAELEPWLRAILAAWRDSAVGSGAGSSIEPWDERHATRRVQPDVRRGPAAGRAAPDRPGVLRVARCRSGGARDPLRHRAATRPRPGRDGVHARRRRSRAAVRTAGRPASSGSSRATAGRGSRTLASSSTRPAMPSTSRAIRTRPAFAVMTEALHHAHRGARRHRRLGSLRAGLAGTLAGPVRVGRGRPPRPLRRCRPRRRLVAVRDRPPSESRARPERGLGRDHERVPGCRARTPSGRGGRSAGSSSRRPATWSTTASGRS